MPKINAEKIKLTCENCGIKWEILKSIALQRQKNGKIRFCGAKCFYSVLKTLEKKCSFCQLNFIPARKSRKFCSNKCRNESRKQNNVPGFWYENGYKVLYDGEGKGIKEHIKIIQEKIGRKLNTDEHVHHINEIRDDNRIENLKLMTKSEHSRLHRLKELNEGKGCFGRIQNQAQIA